MDELKSGMKGYRQTEDHKRKISLANKKPKPWLKGRKRPPFSEEWKNKISLSLKGQKHTEKWKKEQSTRTKIMWRNGTLNKELMKSNSGSFTSENTSLDKHWNWKGGIKIEYRRIHTWVRKIKGNPKFCEICKTITAKKYEWANIDHKYRRVLEDFIRMCVSCHRKHDIKYHNFPKPPKRGLVGVK